MAHKSWLVEGPQHILDAAVVDPQVVVVDVVSSIPGMGDSVLKLAESFKLEGVADPVSFRECLRHFRGSMVLTMEEGSLMPCRGA